MIPRFAAFVLGALMLFAGFMPASQGQGLIDRRARDQHRIEPRGMSLDEAVRAAQSRYGAKAVKADSVSDGDRLVYHIRLLNSEGRVWTVRVDAATGRMY